MEEQKKNKAFEPVSNKQVKIVFKPGRSGAGAVPQDDGTHLASEKDAAYWVRIGYAEYVKE